MYNIYVTNNLNRVVYFRLSNKELTSVNASFHNDLIDYQTKGNVHIFLVGCGFCLVPPGDTLQFAIGISRVYDGTHMYASLYSETKLWVVDKEVDYMNFGCLFVKMYYDMYLENYCTLTHGNPEPVWIKAKNGEDVPTNSIAIDGGMNANAVYLGRSFKGTPCRVTSTNGKCSIWTPGDSHQAAECGQLLQARTSHQWLSALKGDPVPPNAVRVGVSDSEGSLYLGRVGGTEPCSISTEKGNIKDFRYLSLGGEKLVENGELIVLTKDG